MTGFRSTIEAASAFAEATEDKPPPPKLRRTSGRNPLTRTIRGPCTWRSPVLALGNFDGLHRGHVKIIERIQRGAAERGGTSVVLTFDPHPPRILRPDKAPALLMTKAQKLDALARAGVQGAAVVRFTREMSQWEPEHVRAHRAGRMAARRRGVGRRRLPVRPRSQRQLHAAAIARRAATASAPRRSIRSATRTSSSRARAFAGWSAKAASTKPARCSAITTRSTARWSKARSAGREIGFPTANLSTANELIPPHGVYATARHD